MADRWVHRPCGGVRRKIDSASARRVRAHPPNLGWADSRLGLEGPRSRFAAASCDWLDAIAIQGKAQVKALGFRDDRSAPRRSDAPNGVLGTGFTFAQVPVCRVFPESWSRVPRVR